MRAGFEIATAPYVVAMDADGSMDPRELPAYAALFELGYDVVKGSRSAVGGDSTDLTLLRRAGNRGLVGLYNTMFRTRLSDLCYGFIGFRRDKLEVLGLYADGFEIEAQIIAHAQLAELSMAEVPSRESERIHGESNLRTFKDGRRVLRAMMRTRFQPGRELWRHRALRPARAPGSRRRTSARPPTRPGSFPPSDRCPGPTCSRERPSAPRLLWAALATAVLVTIGVASAQSVSAPPRRSYADLAPDPGAGRSSVATGARRRPARARELALLIADNVSRRILITDFSGTVLWSWTNPTGRTSRTPGRSGSAGPRRARSWPPSDRRGGPDRRRHQDLRLEGRPARR
jgi:hypothetical protein